MPVETEVEEGLRRLAPRADAVVDLADEPVVPASRKLRLAALALSLGLAYEAPGARLEPPRYEPVGFDGPKLAVIATGKRTGKTAVAGHWAALLRDAGADPVIVCMGRGGPAEPRLAEAAPTLDELIGIAASGSHAASDYLEDAVIAGVRTVGCRRVGGGFAGAPFDSNVPEGAAARGVAWRRARSCSRAPARASRRWRWTEPCASSAPGRPSRSPSTGSLRADLRARARRARRRARRRRCRSSLRPEPARGAAGRRARGALHHRRRPRCDGVPDPVLVSTNLARRAALARGPRPRRGRSGCDVYLTELKAAAIDTVARRAAPRGRPRGVHPQPARRHRRRARQPVAAMPLPETIVVHKGHGLPVLEGADGAGDLGDRAVAGALVRARPRDRGPARRRAARSATRRPARARRGGAAHRAGRDRRARRYRELAPARPARAPARRPARRHDRRRQVHDRVDARRPARRQPRDRDGRDPPGAARVLHPRGDADGALLGLRGRRDRGLPRPGRAGRHRHRRRSWTAAANEAKPVVVEGVHVVPGGVHPRMRERCVLVEALIVVEDQELHRGHFSHRRGTRPAERYIASFETSAGSRTTCGSAPAPRGSR